MAEVSLGVCIRQQYWSHSGRNLSNVIVIVNSKRPSDSFTVIQIGKLFGIPFADRNLFSDGITRGLFRDK